MYLYNLMHLYCNTKQELTFQSRTVRLLRDYKQPPCVVESAGECRVRQSWRYYVAAVHRFLYHLPRPPGEGVSGSYFLGCSHPHLSTHKISIKYCLKRRRKKQMMNEYLTLHSFVCIFMPDCDTQEYVGHRADRL